MSGAVAQAPEDGGEEAGTARRRLSGAVAWLTAAIAVASTAFHLYTAAFGSLPNLMQRSVHVGFALVLAFLLYGWTKRAAHRVAPLDWLLALLAVAGCGWVLPRYDVYMARADIDNVDIAAGALTVALVVEAVRRVIGLPFALLVVAFIAYAFLGPHVPMPFGHRGLSLRMLSDHLYTTDLGIWGTTTHITATVVAVFVIFGAVLLQTGGGRAFIDLALLLAGRSAGGPAKVAVLASGLFGTISGSAAANVAVTGSLTIPMMKRLGYRREFAGAVEATASTGGQLMPPIMGAGAFIMAELLAMPYFSIVAAALIPALLFYGSVFAAIHFESLKRNYAALPAADLPRAREVLTLARMAPFIGPLLVLVALLLTGRSAQYAGFWATLAAAALYLVVDFRAADLGPRLKVLLKAAEQAGYALVMIAALSAAAQIVVGIIGVTGVGVRFTSILIAASSGELLFGLLIAMLAALVLGMGMPTTAAYLLAASVLAPALARLGLVPLQAHMFVFYYAIISAITPPVCAAVFVAAGIAGSDWVKTAFIACRLGAVAFIIPLMFAYAPALLMIGSPAEIALAVVTATIGVLALAGGLMGYLLKRCNPVQSLLLVLGALPLIKPGLYTDAAGLAVVGTAVAWQWLEVRQARRAAAAE